MNARSVICVVVGALGATLAGCTERLTVPNFQNPTVASVAADPLTAVPLLATGVLRSDRGNMPAYVWGVGILGREAYNYVPTGDFTTGWLTSDVNNRTAFGSAALSLWGGPYTTVRDAFVTLQVIEAAGPVFTDPQRNAMRGLLHTEIALSLLYALNTRHAVGITVDVYDDPAKLAPFVSRDSAFTFIAALLDQARTELAAGGTTFPFALPSGFAGFTTPATFAKFNRGLAARVNAYRASLGAAGCGAARSAPCYQLVLAALQSSFLDPAGSLTTFGVFNTYSAASGDVSNSNSNQANPNIVAHAKADSGIQTKADGGNDNRFTAKVIKLSSPKLPPLSGVPTSWDYSIYALRTDPIAIIRNEELVLLRAEARYFTGDPVGALADINLVRTKAGGLDARASFATDKEFLDELLYNRRLSLLFEGHRWIDMRRFGRLDQLTLDLASHVVVPGLPLPQAECLERVNAVASLKGPGC